MIGSTCSGSEFLILGGGTWGCSIALELARRGHKSIVVLEGSPFPSPISAGNDLNKIAEEAGELDPDTDTTQDYFWKRVAKAAMHMWKQDPLFAPFYHETGFIMAAVGDDAYERCAEYEKCEGGGLVRLDKKEDFQKTMPLGVLQGDFQGWRGFWKRGGAGWVFASGSLRAMHAEAEKLGVLFVTEHAGRVEELLYSPGNDSILGARTADGSKHLSRQTILAMGANSDLLLDFKGQLRPTAWTLAHLPLLPEESPHFRNLPVLYGVDRVCDEHPGYINPTTDRKGTLRSVPFARNQIPKEAKTRMRRLLSETVPQFVDRPFSFARICWDADTVDRIFLIDKHPDLRNLIVAAGGSGNGFMACPAVGVLVADLLEGTLDVRLGTVLRWRPEISEDRDLWDAQGRYGADGSVMDFRDVTEWTECSIT